MLESIIKAMNPNDIINMLTSQIDTPEKLENIKQNLKRIPINQETKEKVLALCEMVKEALQENPTIN